MPSLIDISMPLKAGMLLYPGTPPFEWEEYRKIANGDTSNNSRFSMGTHVGTHVDAPAHYVESGNTLDGIDCNVLVGMCRVIHLPSKQIDADALRRAPFDGVTRALFRTPSSAELSTTTFNPDFAHVTSDGADYLLESGIKLVGVDYLSVDKYKSPEHPAHHKLLGAGVIVIEGLDLSQVEAGDYELICCPLRISGAEAAPARAFLRRA